MTKLLILNCDLTFAFLSHFNSIGNLLRELAGIPCKPANFRWKYILTGPNFVVFFFCSLLDRDWRVNIQMGWLMFTRWYGAQLRGFSLKILTMWPIQMALCNVDNFVCNLDNSSMKYNCACFETGNKLTMQCIWNVAYIVFFYFQSLTIGFICISLNLRVETKSVELCYLNLGSIFLAFLLVSNICSICPKAKISYSVCCWPSCVDVSRR